MAAPVWARMMLRVYQKRPMPPPWPRPAGIIEGMVDPASGMLLASGCRPWSGTAYRELFVRGTAPLTVCPSQGEAMLLDPMALPPLPDLEEGMETGVPRRGDRPRADGGAAAGGDGAGRRRGDARRARSPDASPTPAPPLSYAPSSPARPQPAPPNAARRSAPEARAGATVPRPARAPAAPDDSSPTASRRPASRQQRRGQRGRAPRRCTARPRRRSPATTRP